MNVYRTVRKANEALDKFLRRQGYNVKQGHYCRPNGTKGPIVRYGGNGFELLFAVDRVPTGGWTVSTAWLHNNKGIVPLELLFVFGIWQEAVDEDEFLQELMAMQ